MLIAVLAGCGADSKSEPESDSGGKEEQATANEPSDQQVANEKMSDARGSRAPAPESPSRGTDTTEGKSNDTADERKSDMNKMRQVAISMHNYEAAYKKFPMASTGDDKVSKDLSWRVLVLPFMEFLDEYKKFDVSQPWDSDKNKPLTESRAREAFELGNGNLICAIKRDEQPKSFAQIFDGASNTIALMESPAGDANQWTSPADIEVEDGVKRIKSLKKGEFLLVALYDGSVRKIYSIEGKDLKDEEIAALFGHRDGLPINRDIFLQSK